VRTVRTEREWRALLTDALAQAAGLPTDQISPTQPFVEYGLSSVDLVGLAGSIEDHLGHELAPTIAYEYPTVDALAAHLAAPVRRPDAAGPAGAARPAIAIVGMSCRVPGGRHSADALWQGLLEGFDGITEAPADRWSNDEWYSADQEAPGRVTTRYGGFLDDVTGFDADFFGISEREAAQMDPAQRLLCEVCWDALDDAGVPPETLAGTTTAVYVGISNGDHGHMTFQRPKDINAYSGTGAAYSITANRLSYLLDVHGPSMAIDTACSSSLVAVDAACTALMSGGCPVAIVAGVNMTLGPQVTVNFSKAGALAEDGRCKAFDASADGFVRSEGVGVVVLKTLEDAVAHGDRVYAVIRGSAVTQDGRTNGIMAPGGRAQETAIRQACAGAGIDPADVGYVEAHGTGTSLGDPIEANAVGSVLAPGRAADSPCLIGSLKTNIGHAEGAAGLLGLIKAALVVHHRLVPPTIHFREPNPQIDFAGLKLAVPTVATPWPGEGPVIAGVNSFGFGGTNAHVVLGSVPRAPAGQAGSGPEADAADWPLLVSARSPGALDQRLVDVAAVLSRTPDADISALCSTAALRTTHHEYRAIAWGGDAATFGAGLREAAPNPPVRAGRSSSEGLAFVFPGQGPRWWPLADDLMDDPSFAATIGDAARVLEDLGMDWKLPEVLRGAGGVDPADPAVGQPALCAVQIALAGVWRSRGLTPGAVIGHSLGEVAAAHISGSLGLDAALAVALQRGRAIRDTALPGSMLLVSTDSADVQRTIDRDDQLDRVWIAAVNSPQAVVVSGEVAQVARLAGILAKAEVDSFDLSGVRFASHCPLVEPAAAALAAGLRDGVATAGPSSIPMLSTATSAWVQDFELDAEYWARNLRSPVRFLDSLRVLAAAGFTTFVEVSPHTNLLPDIQAALQDHAGRAVAFGTLRRDQPAQPQLRQTSDRLFLAGAAVDWAAAVAGDGPVTPLPPYPWQHRHYPVAAATTTGGEEPPLGVVTVDADTGRTLRTVLLGPGSHPYLADHVVSGQALVPAAFLLDSLVATARVAVAGSNLRTVRIDAPLAIGDDGRADLQVVSTGSRLRLFGRTGPEPDMPWQPLGSAEIDLDGHGTSDGAGPTLADARQSCVSAVDVEDFYRRLAQAGLTYGTAFRGIEQLWRHPSGGTALAHLTGRRASWHDDPIYPTNPMVLDAALQVVAAATPERIEPTTWIPVGCDRFWVAPGTVDARWAHAETLPTDGDSPDRMSADVTLFDEQGTPVALVEGLALRRLPAPAGRAATRLYDLIWEPWSPTNPASVTHPWWLVADPADQLARRLAARIDDVSGGGPRFTTTDAIGESDGGDLTVVFAAALGVRHDPTAVDGAAVVEFALEHVLAPFLATVRNLAALDPAPGHLRLVVPTIGAQGRHRDPLQAMLWGMARVVRAEQPDWDVIVVDLASTAELGRAEMAQVLTATGSHELLVRDGSVLTSDLAGTDLSSSPRVRAIAPTAHQAYRLGVEHVGLLDSMRAVVAARVDLAPDEVEIEVIAAGVNFADVLKALGQYPGAGPDPVLGGECSGIVARVGERVLELRPGDRVISAASGALGAFAVSTESLTVRLPDGIDPEQAAGLPLAFLTARYCLEDLARLRPGETVLIHSATGGVGSAALAVAGERGAVVYATAGSPERREHLAALPDVAGVFDSRSTRFAQQIRSATGGRGVDVVLNSLSGLGLEAGLGLLAPGGRFVEIGKTDLYRGTAISLGHLRENRSLLTFDLEDLLRHRPEVVSETLRDTVHKIATGSYRLPRTTTYPADAAAEAFTDMARSRHDGKLVLSMTPPPATVQHRAPLPLPLDPSTYLITGGLGSLGRILATAVLDSGAACVVLAGRHEPDQAAAEWVAASGGRIVTAVADVADRASLDRVVETIARDLPPLRGVIHAAGTLADAPATALTTDQVRSVLLPKLAGAVNLEAATSAARPAFIAYISSASAVLGLAGQAGYAAANAALDAMATRPARAATRIVSIGYGPLDVGGLARDVNESGTLTRLGIEPIPADAAVGALAAALDEDRPRDGAPDVMVLRTRPAALAEAVAIGLLPAILAAQADDGGTADDAGSALRGELLGLQPGPQRHKRMLRHCVEQAGLVLQRPAESIPPDAPLASLGFDSLMSLELGRRLGTTTGITVSSSAVWRYPTLDGLSAFVGGAMGVLLDEQPPDSAAPDDAPSDAADRLDGLSDDEAAAELVSMLDRFEQ
jgi:phthiocerol/phenolphthiocerol synthesis type-I polyketide synthase C